jgi:hypothetical protein
MAHSKAKLKSSGDIASPCFRPFWIGKLSDKFHIKNVNTSSFNTDFSVMFKCTQKLYNVTLTASRCWPPLWSSDQSSRLQISRSGFDSQRYQIF